MNGKERMLKALEGKNTDVIPVAPYFWGAEYIWKVADYEIWELQYGGNKVEMEAKISLQKRHPCDWLVFFGSGSNWLKDKKIEREKHHIYFIDENNGDKYEYLEKGHHIVKLGEENNDFSDTTGILETKEEVDEWWGKNVISNKKSKKEFNECLKKLISRYGEETLITGCATSPFIKACYTLGFEAAMMSMYEYQDVFYYLMDKHAEEVEENLSNLAENGLEAVIIVESWASADIISPEWYQKFALPYQQKAIRAAHDLGMKVIFYSTGYLMPFLEHMKELEFDALTVEENRKGFEMAIKKVRDIIGTERCLFGNFDPTLLLKNNREEIDKEILRQTKAAKKGSFVMGTGSPICDGTDPEMIDYFINKTRDIDI